MAFSPGSASLIRDSDPCQPPAETGPKLTGRSAVLLLDFAEQLAHSRGECGGEHLHDCDRRHRLPTFEQADEIAMQVRHLRKTFLGEAGGKWPVSKDFAKTLLEWMHGSIPSGK